MKYRHVNSEMVYNLESRARISGRRGIVHRHSKIK
uniref:Uncharacterized protein n=1 Tax=Siphoviridae sp. ctJT77 TaxID=2825432 RepID=A0A8S5UZM2_9CAUD|nr:MAG TPA: hypothetical protein [Siphoviridae sp. ctJT77]